MATAILLGCGLTACAVSLRWIYHRYRSTCASNILSGQSVFTQYYKGGFESKMTRREAGLILGVSERSSLKEIKDAHRRSVLANHPDRGGSPYLALKINEAKSVLENSEINSSR